MRLILSMQAKSGELVLPIHYNRLIQGMIYANISNELAAFLHDRGYIEGKRSFKFFTFSRLLGKYRLNNRNKQIYFPEGARLVVASPIKEFCTSLMGCILGDGVVNLGGVSTEVTGINAEKPAVTEGPITLNLLSPVVTYSTFEKPEGGKYTCYYQPGEKEFAKQVEENLRKKYLAFYKQPALDSDFSLKLINRPQLNITMYKQTVIKGYSCRIGMDGPPDLLQVALDAGLGAKNSQGFGCVEIDNERKEQSFIY